MNKSNDRVLIPVLFLIIFFVFITVFKIGVLNTTSVNNEAMVHGVMDHDGMSVTFKDSYQPSFLSNLISRVGLSSAYTALNGSATGKISYIEVIQHDDMAQLKSSEYNKIRKDYVPDYANIATVAAKSSGNWSDVFSGYSFDKNSIVLIPEGININYDMDSGVQIKGIAIKGRLSFDQNKNTNLKIGTIVLYPSGKYEDRPSTSVSHKIIFSGEVDKSIDPFQMTIGFVSIGGTVEVVGKDVKEYSKIISASGNTLSLETTSGLNVGDFIIIYETPNLNKVNLKQQILKVNSIQGNQVTTNNPINISAGRFAIFATRNIVFQSDSIGDRGHMMFLGDTTVTLKNIAVIDLGRTTTSATVSVKKVGDTYIPGDNQIGRYPIHAHHLQKKFIFEGNVVYGNREENIFYYKNLSRRVVNTTPISVYVYTGKDPLEDQMDPVVWPTSHDVVASSNGRWWLLYNPIGEVPAPTAEATGFAPYKTRIGSSNDVEILDSSNNWVKTGWIKYKAVIKNGKIYGDGSVDTGIQVVNTPIASPKWGIVSHNSFGDIRNNVVIGAEGSGITTEEGLESGKIDSNLVVGLGGGTGEHDDKRWWGFGLKKLDLGYGGVAFWHASMITEITNNIADGLFRFGVYVVYHPYDVNGAVPSLNNSNQYIFPNIPGMPEQLANHKGFTSGIMKFENNTSYAESGHKASSLMLINIGSTDIETTNPHNVVSNFTAYHKGISMAGMTIITFTGLKLYGDGTGIGIDAGDTDYTLINSEVKNFSNGISYDRHSMNIVDSVVDNVRNNPQARAKIYYDSIQKQKDRIQKNKDTYTKEAIKENKDANFIAILDHDNVFNKINKDNSLKGWASIDIDKEKQTVTLKWNMVGNDSPLVNIDVVVPSRDRGIPAIIPDKIKRVFMVSQENTKYSGSYTVTKADIESGRYFPGKYSGVQAVTFEEFIDYLNKGQVEIRFITNHVLFLDSGSWIEAQGNFTKYKGVSGSGEVKPAENKPIETTPDKINQVTVPVGQTPKAVDSMPAPDIGSQNPTLTPTQPVAPVINNSNPNTNTNSNTQNITTNNTSSYKYTKATNGFVSKGGDPSASASKVSVNEDKASANSYSSGSYNNISNDWVWDLTINTPSDRKIHDIKVVDGESSWSTIEDTSWPLVAFKDGKQMHTTRSDPFTTTTSGSNKVRLYGQQRNSSYKTSKIIINFDQGDYIEVDNVK